MDDAGRTGQRERQGHDDRHGRGSEHQSPPFAPVGQHHNRHGGQERELLRAHGQAEKQPGDDIPTMHRPGRGGKHEAEGHQVLRVDGDGERGSDRWKHRQDDDACHLPACSSATHGTDGGDEPAQQHQPADESEQRGVMERRRRTQVGERVAAVRGPSWSLGKEPMVHTVGDGFGSGHHQRQHRWWLRLEVVRIGALRKAVRERPGGRVPLNGVVGRRPVLPDHHQDEDRRGQTPGEHAAGAPHLPVEEPNGRRCRVVDRTRPGNPLVAR